MRIATTLRNAWRFNRDIFKDDKKNDRKSLEARGFRRALNLGIKILIVGFLIQLLSFGIGKYGEFPRFRLIGIFVATLATAIGTVGAGFLFSRNWMKVADKGKDERFRRFFGESAVEDAPRLVHAERQLKSDKEVTMDFVCPSATRIKDIEKSRGNEIAPEGIGRWLSAEDNYAATAITAAFSERSSKFPRQVYDSFMDDDTMPFCTVGLGLGFNEFTYFLCALTRGRMFRVIFKKSIKPAEIKQNLLTDEFTVPFYEDQNEAPNWYYPMPTENNDVALIVRVPTKPTNEDDFTTQFLVCGRTASGTAVAGAFLAKEWEQLEKLYTDNHKDIEKDALLVILEHKSSLRISGLEPKSVIFKSGARFYRGRYGTHEPASLEEALGIGDHYNQKDQDSFRAFTKSVRDSGYGFYNPNVGAGPEEDTSKAVTLPADHELPVP